jgi:predicted O-methyltransferase YrrM
MGRMTIEETQKCNSMSLELAAEFFGVNPVKLLGYYQELQEDDSLLDGLNHQILVARQDLNYEEGIFRHASLSSVDWFACQRILLYVLVRLLRPAVCVETGVLYGGNTAFILNGLHRNGCGRLISIDLPSSEIPCEERHSKVGDSESLSTGTKPGFLVPQYLRSRWEFVEGDSLEVLANIGEEYSLFCHDSEHSRDFVIRELDLVKQSISPDGVIIADDIDWSNGFFEFCVNNRLYPLLLTDNGKDALRVRTGIARLSHPFNGKAETTGSK